MPQYNSVKGNILLVDDEYAICVGVSGLLELNGFRADYVQTAEEGIEYLEKHPETDVVLLDINLGTGMSGIEALPVLRERFKYTQIMMFTSHDTLSTGLECMKKGACDYLTKPFIEQEFLKKVPAALARKQLARLNDLYLGILVHDLKNPLQCIIGAWDLVKLKCLPTLNESQKSILGAGDIGIAQIRAMIENILTVSKFESGTFAVSMDDFYVDKEAENAIASLREQIVSSGRSFSMDFQCGTPYRLVSDRELFTRVLFNIVSNALRYTTANGAIRVSFSETEEGFLQTEITNTGSYIDEARRHSIFDKFASVHKLGQAGGVRNYGLGLTFSKMAVEALGGEIRVECSKDVPSTTFFYTVRNNKE
jgi:two-component system, sensor histidine kinase and response regulator